MKQTFKILSLILAVGLISGCNLTPNKSNPKSSLDEESGSPDITLVSSSEKEDKTSDKSSEDKSSSQSQSSSQKEGTSSTGGEETEGAFTFNDSELNTPQEIHTANQKKYLNLDKRYLMD